MAKKKREKPQRILTPHQISHWEQQKKRQRIIFIAGILVIVAVLVIVGLGWYFGQFKPLHETVIEVKGTGFTMDYYVEMLKLERSFHQAADASSLTESVQQNIMRNELIRHGALELGISVTDEEVQVAIENNDLPDKKVYRDLVRQQLLIELLLERHFDPQVPLYAEQRQVMAMMLESEEQALDVRSRLLSISDNFSELAEELSLEPFSRSNGGDFGWITESILVDMLPASIVEAIFNHPVGELSQPIYEEEAQKPVGYWLVEVLERDEEAEEAHIQIMLLGSEAEALDIRRQLEAGADWATLAVEHSQAKGVKENKGEWMVSPGEINPSIDAYAFDPDTETGAISEPVKDESITTKGGYWLIEITDEDSNRRLDASYQDYLKNKALDEWVASLLDGESNEIVNNLDVEKIAWAVKLANRG